MLFVGRRAVQRAKLRHSRLEIQTLSPELRQYRAVRTALLNGGSLILSGDRPKRGQEAGTKFYD